MLLEKINQPQICISVILAISLLFSCKEENKNQTAPPLFILNAMDTLGFSEALYIETECQEYSLEIVSHTGDSIYVALNNQDFLKYGGKINLSEDLRNISAYSTHRGFENSSISNLEVNFKSQSFQSSTKVYPNPTPDSITVNMENAYRGDLSITILDTAGKVLQKTEANKTSDFLMLKIDLSQLNEGIYLIKVANSSCEFTGKIIRN